MAKVKIEKVNSFTFGRRNLLILGIGVITIAIGFILMAQPPVYGFLSRTLSPIILVIAYIFIIPYSVLTKNKSLV